MGQIFSRYEVRRKCLDEALTYLSNQREAERQFHRGGWRMLDEVFVEPNIRPSQRAPVSSRMMERFDRHLRHKMKQERRATNRRERERRVMDRSKWPRRLGRRLDRQFYRNRHGSMIDNHIAHACEIFEEDRRQKKLH